MKRRRYSVIVLPVPMGNRASVEAIDTADRLRMFGRDRRKARGHARWAARVAPDAMVRLVEHWL